MVQFVGPSYQLAVRKAAIDRAVNLFLVAMETPGKAPWILKGIPGLITRWSLSGEVRGSIEVGSRAFAVVGGTLYELFSDYTSTVRGTLATNTGTVDMAYGLFQVVVVDGGKGYVLTISSNAFQQITDPDWPGSKTVRFLDNYFLFIHPETQQGFISAINDATNFDALDFASAESSPDDLVAQAVLHEQWIQFGELTTEFWRDFGSADYPFERSQGTTLQIGCQAVYSVQEVDSSVFFIGRDKNGSGMVYRYSAGQIQRISTQAVEQALQASSDLSSATSYAYQQDGRTFYCINAPGLNSTWCFEVASSSWHERCDLDALGQLTQHRGTRHLHAFGKHFLGAADGRIYELNRDTYTNAGDVLVRERISPHNAIMGRIWQFFTAFYLDCTTGEAAQGDDPQVELSYSDDSGANWSNPSLKSTGRVGNRLPRILWTRLGRARDRVWKVRFTANAPFDIIDAAADSTQGTS